MRLEAEQVAPHEPPPDAVVRAIPNHIKADLQGGTPVHGGGRRADALGGMVRSGHGALVRRFGRFSVPLYLCGKKRDSFEPQRHRDTEGTMGSK